MSSSAKAEPSETHNQGVTLTDATRSWPTPVVADSDRTTPTNMRGNPTLDGMARAEEWPTPQAHDAQTPKTPEQLADHRERTRAGASNLNEAADGWPTPQAYSAQHSNRPTSVGLDREAAKWPTPRAEDSESAGNHPDAVDSLTGATAMFRADDAEMSPADTVTDSPESATSDSLAPALWPTPDAMPRTGVETSDQLRQRGSGGVDLNSAVDNWPTPDTQNTRDGATRRTEATGKHAMSLHHAADQWPTPSAQGSQGETSDDLERRGSNLHNAETGRILQTNLATEAKHWTPTPESDWRTPSSRDWKRDRTEGDPIPTLADQVSSLQDPATATPGAPSSSDGQNSRRVSPARPKVLNPLFVAWLMGWPLNWIIPYPTSLYSPASTRSVSSEMASFRSKLRSRLLCLVGD